MKILTFAASNSHNSINKILAAYASSLIEGADVEVIDLNDFELPLFSVDTEEKIGTPQLAKQLFNKIGHVDALVVSYAEHNGSYTAAYKNIFDWMSRIDQNVFQGKPMIMLSTSPGQGGGANVLSTATNSAPYFKGNLKGSMSVKSFYDNFDVDNNEFINEALKKELITVMANLRA